MNSANNNKRGGDYEKLILEKIMYEFDENFSYELNYRIQGIVSKTVREFDIAIFRKDEQHPFWIIECKNWKEDQVKNKFIKEIEQMPIKIKNLNKNPELITLIVSSYPSRGAINTADNENIKIEVLSREVVRDRKWFKEACEIFPYDTICHPQILQVKKLIQKNDIIGAIDKLENIYYEEWLAIIDYSIAYYPIIALRMLEFVAEYHYDDAWRFNAIQKLVEYNYLKDDFKEKLLITETDFDTRELLLEYS